MVCHSLFFFEYRRILRTIHHIVSIRNVSTPHVFMPQFYYALYAAISHCGTLGCTLELRRMLLLDTKLCPQHIHSGNADLVCYLGVYQGRTRLIFLLYAQLGPVHSGFSNTRISRDARKSTCYPPYSGLGAIW